MIADSFSSNPIPEIIIQTPELLLDLECCDRIFSHGIYLESVADDPWIEEDFFKYLIGHFWNFLDIPIMEMVSILFSLAEHCDPRESCLSSLESEELE
jgi:hypothetical protein